MSMNPSRKLQLASSGTLKLEPIESAMHWTNKLGIALAIDWIKVTQFDSDKRLGIDSLTFISIHSP